jgi:hypothetical protein
MMETSIFSNLVKEGIMTLMMEREIIELDDAEGDDRT